MRVRRFDLDKDYDELYRWWKIKGWSPIVPTFLKYGWIAENEDGTLIASTFMFPTTTPVFIMEWTVGNPDLDWEVRRDGINMVIDAASDWAKENGGGAVFTMTKKGRFVDKLKDLGFEQTDKDMIHFVRRI